MNPKMENGWNFNKVSVKMKWLWVFTAFLGLINFANAQCNYSLKLYDSWGDGWNGGTIDVKLGSTVTNYGLSNGTDTTIVLSVSTGDSIVLDYLGGSAYNSEVSFELIDPGQVAIYNSGSGPATGVAYADTAACPPPNETCATAFTLIPGDTVSDSGPSSGGGCYNCTSGATDASWYSFTPSRDGTIDISACGMSATDTRLWIYEGSCGSLVQVAADDDGCGASDGWASALTGVAVTAGTTYYIEWDNRWSSSAFDFVFDYTANGSTCASANVIAGTDTITDPGPSLGGGCFNCSSGATNANWYSFTAPSNGTVDITACGQSAVDTRLWMYEGSCGSLVQVGADDDGCGSSDGYASELIGEPVTAGTTYYIEWDNRWSSSGFDFAFTFNQVSCALSGTYSIDASQAASATNYTSLSAAAADITSCGVSGPVTFNIAAGTYNDTAYLGTYLGMSASNTVTFDGGNSANTEIIGNGTNQNAVILLDGAQNITFTNIKISHPGTSDAWGIRINDDASGLNINNCEFNMQTVTSTSADVQAIAATGSSTSSFTEVDLGDGITIMNNTITGGDYGIHLEANSSFSDSTVVISNNHISGTYQRGIMTDNLVDLTVENNYAQVGTSSSAYGIAIYDVIEFEINGNTIIAEDQGLLISDGNYNFDGTPSTISNVTNNLVLSFGDEAGDFDDVERTNIFHNTFVTSAASTSAYGCYFNDLDSVDIRNNIFYAENAYAVYSSDAGFSSANVVVDYNLYYSNGSNLAYEGGAQADLAAWQAASAAYNANSVSADPVFVDITSDVHVLGTPANDAGTPIASVTTDVDGDARSATTPDIGADEFAPASCFPSANMMATALFTDSISLNWEPGTGTTYTVEFDTTGFAQGTGTQLTAIADTFTTVTGLMANATYDFYIQDDCGAGGTSVWVGPFTFSTLCNADTIPYAMDFNSGMFPSCWSRTDAAEVTVESVCDIRSNVLEFNYEHEAITVDIDATGAQTIQVGYYLSAGACTNDPEDSEHFQIFYWDGTQWVMAKDYDGTWPQAFVWDSFIVPQSALTSSFKVKFDMIDGTTDAWHIDSLVVEEGPSCAPPTNLGATAVLSASADVFWTSGGATDWNVEYGLSGFSQGAGTALNATNDTLTLTGLAPNTDYDFYVRDSCAVGDVSSWSGPYTFTTACAALTAPHIESFDNSSLPSCWSTYSSTGELFEFGSNTYGPSSDHTGNSGGYANVDDSQSPASPDVTLESPLFDVSSLNSPELRFFLASQDASVTVSVDVWDGTSWNIGVFSQAAATVSTWDEIIVNLSSYSAGGTIAFRFVVDEDNGSFQNDIGIDDIEVRDGAAGPCTGPFTVPYTENFDTAQGCFTVINGGGGPESWFQTSTATDDLDGTGYMRVDSDADGNGTLMQETLESPVVDASGISNILLLEFDQYFNAIGGDSAAVDVYDGSNWVNVYSTTSDAGSFASPDHQAIDITAYANANLQVRFYYDDGNNWAWYWAVDNFSLTEVACLPQSLPYTENFDVDQGCFSIVDGGGGPESWFHSTSTDNLDGTPYMRVDSDVDGNGVLMQETLLSPVITAGNVQGTLTLEFDHYFNAIGGDSAAVDVYDGTNWVNVYATTSSVGAFSSPDHQIIDITAYANNNLQVRFYYDDGNNWAWYWAVDNFSVTDVSCADPTSLGATNITTSSADLFWTTGGAANWNIEFDTAGFTPGTGTMQSVTNDTVNISGLSPATSYDFYVQDSCGAGNLSSWVGPFTFSTLCPAFTAPYIESFDSSSTPNCWSESGSESWIYSTGAGYAAGSAGDHTGNSGNYAWIDGSTPSGPSQISTLTSPLVDITGLTNPELRFYVFSNNTDDSGNNTLDVEFYDGANWDTVYTNQSNLGSNWFEVTVDLSVYTITGDVQARFTISENSSGSAFYNDILIDDVEFRNVPACAAPSALGVTNLSTTSADVFWTTGGATNWNVEYGLAGFTQGAGTTVNATNDTLNITGLSASTGYEFYVRDSCAVGDVSPWVGPFAFNTLCAPFVAPYTQTFDQNAVPTCWSSYEAAGSAWEFGQLGAAGYAAGTAAEQTGNGGYYAWIDFSGTDDSTNLEIYDVDISALTTPGLQFSLFSNNTNSTDYNILYVEAYDGTSWLQVDSLQGDLGGWKIFNMDISSYVYNTNLVRIRFRGESGGGGSDFHNDLLIDDVSILELPLCLDPTNFSATGTTTSSVSLSWTSDTNVTASTIQYGAVGFTLGSGTTVSASTVGSTTISGLMQNTCYDFYVLDTCGAATNWVGPLTVCTQAPCTVTGTPTNAMGDTTDCDGGPVNLSASATGGQRVLWKRGNTIIGTGSPFVADSIGFTTTFEASNFSTSGGFVHVGPQPSISAAGFGNFTNGQYINVLDTIVIDSTTVRADGAVTAQVIISDQSVTAGGIISQRGEVFTTPAGVTGNYQVPVGVVLTPGQYFISIDFLPGTVGSLFRATGGAVYPYVAPGLMSIDSVNFTGPRYYYTFDLVLQKACIGTGTASAIGYVPGANAGTSDSVTVCETNSAADLTAFLGTYDFGGTWSDDDATGALTDSIFDATQVAAGSSYNFTYAVSGINNCAGDSATVTVTVEASPNAGASTVVSVCQGTGPAILRNYLTVSPFSGTWIDIDQSGAFNTGSSVLNTNNVSVGTYNFGFIVAGTACPNDTAIVTVSVDSTVNAGSSFQDTACLDDGIFDLNSLLAANVSAGGTWIDVNATGALIGSQFDPSAVALNNSYDFRYVLRSACGDDSATVSLYVEDCDISIREYQINLVDIYPNPTSGMVNIVATGVPANFTVELYSLNGQLLISRSFNGQSEMKLDLSDLAAGAYTLRVQSDSNYEMERIIKK